MAEVAHKEVLEGLKRLYAEKIRPVEAATFFQQFYSSPLADAEFDAPPMILLVGPYSVGKTSFIKYLVGKDFPGSRIGPEPTTDRFTAVMYGEEERVVPGNALTVAPGSPFGGLTHFGNGFLTRFEGSQMPGDFTSKVTLIDSPGVLSGEKQRLGRSYNFEKVVEWFAQRVDLIILLFDANKLDISDEMKNVIYMLKGNEDKVRVVLNKADVISHQQLMRVYGALMWSLGKVMQTPEVSRVYIGSFWETPLRNPETSELLQEEMNSLLYDLSILPRQGAMRKLNELVKRTRLLKVHAYLLGQLRSSMPSMFGKKKAQDKIIAEMSTHFRKCQSEHGLAPGDFPSLDKFISVVKEMDFTTLPNIKGKRMRGGKAVTGIENALAQEIPRLMAMLPGVHTVDGEAAGGE